MREKLQTLSLTVLKELAKDKGIKNTSTMKKADIIEAILAAADNEKSTEAAPAARENTRINRENRENTQNTQPVQNDDPYRQDYDPAMIDKGPEANGILEVMPEGYGFIRC